MNRERWRFRLGVGAALLAGLLLRLWFVHHLPLVAGDSLIYGDIARNWLQHGVYGFNEVARGGSVEIRPTLIRLPGYPIFLAACFRVFGMENYRAVMGVQVAVDIATCCLTAALAARLFGRRAGIAVLWLAALCPFTANYVATPLTETLVLNSIALAFFAFAKWQDAGCELNRWAWVIGAALAWSVLLRPDQGLLATAVLAAMIWRVFGRGSSGGGIARAMPALAAALCVAAPLSAWTMRNWHTFHVFQPLAPRNADDPGELAPVGFNRWYRTWAIDFDSSESVYWNYSGDRIETANLPARAFDAGSEVATMDMRNRTSALLADYNKTTVVTPAIDARFATLAAKRAHAHPILYWLGLPLARLADMALRPRTEMLPVALEWWRWSEHRGQTAFAAGYAALNFGYLAAGLGGFYLWRRRAWAAIDAAGFGGLAFAMAASLILRCTLLLTLDNSEPRYTLEFFPVLLVWAGALFVTSPGRAAARSG